MALGLAQVRAAGLVAIDVGHTPAVHGATSARGAKEYDFNRRIALQLHQRLRKETNLRSLLINPKEKEISLMDRIKEALAADADVFLSIHHDAVQDKYLSKWEFAGAWQSYSDTFRGYSVFCSGKNPEFEESRKLALLLGEEMTAAGFGPTLHHNEPVPGENRPLLNEKLGVYQFDDLVVLKYNKIPAVLLECGVIVHREEEADLLKPETQERIVTAIIHALHRWFK
jgi:N-acetylmuramoyl-L-alanine amidase